MGRIIWGLSTGTANAFRIEKTQIQLQEPISEFGELCRKEDKFQQKFETLHSLSWTEQEARALELTEQYIKTTGRLYRGRYFDTENGMLNYDYDPETWLGFRGGEVSTAKNIVPEAIL